MTIIDHWFNCEDPKIVTNRFNGQKVQIPCGKCTACTNRRVLKWLPALTRESLSHKYTDFITLTYSDKYLPHTDLLSYNPGPEYVENYENLVLQSIDFIKLHNFNIPSLSTVDIQKFIKRLREIIYRKYGLRKAVRYYIAGDFGSTLFRPHYHGMLFYDDDRLSTEMSNLIVEAWSLSNERGESELIGRVDCQRAYGCASYCSTYTSLVADCPSIYSFRDFKAKSLHSSFPPLGSLISPVETLEEIVDNGLREITIYDANTFVYKKTSLLPSIIRRLFPQIPSFCSLNHSERMEIYRIVCNVCDLEPSERRNSLLNTMFLNSFFNDYVTLNNASLTLKQIYDKLDRIYYMVRLLMVASSSRSISIGDYDLLIFRYKQNCAFYALKTQFEFENRYLLAHPECDVRFIIDISYARYKDSEKNAVDPLVIDSDFFRYQSDLNNSLIKRKCDNAYLELHPEFKQFH